MIIVNTIGEQPGATGGKYVAENVLEELKQLQVQVAQEFPVELTPKDPETQPGGETSLILKVAGMAGLEMQ